MAELATDHEVFAWDLPGHAQSPVFDEPAEYTRDRVLEDLDDVIAETGAKPVLVGHSLGGYLTLAHAATRTEASSGIVVFATGPGFRNPEKREEWNAMSRRNAHRFGVPEQAAEMNLQQDSVVMDRLAEMTVPTLVMSGSEDRPDYTGSGQYLEKKMADARFVSIEGGDHFMHEGSHTAEIAGLIRSFVSRVSTT